MRCPACFEEKGDDVYCPHCGSKEQVSVKSLALPLGSTLYDGRYQIGSVLGEGGFGVTYLAWDTHLKSKVAIKEYCPSFLGVGRDSVDHGTVHSAPSRRDEFELGLEDFLKEAQKVAKFRQHKNIVHVHDHFEENRTAYMVMEFYDGKSLSKYLENHGRPLAQAQAISIMIDVLEGLQAIHDEGMFHLDIKPHNICLTREGNYVILDFGSARYATGERSQSISQVISPGYSPPEQYQSKGKLESYTDIYACGATLYQMVTGEKPPPAVERVGLRKKRLLKPPQTFGVSPQLSELLLETLAIKPKHRPQTAKAFQQKLIAMQSEEDPTLTIIPEVEPERHGWKDNLGWVAGSVLLVLALVAFVLILMTVFKPDATVPVAPPPRVITISLGVYERVLSPAGSSRRGSSLLLKAVPDGKISLDGGPEQLNELDAPVAAGLRSIRFTHPLYGPRDVIIEVEQGQRKEIVYYFEGALDVQATDTTGEALSAVLVVNNLVTGIQIPMAEYFLSPGEYVIEVYRKGYYSQPLRVEVNGAASSTRVPAPPMIPLVFELRQYH